MNITLSIDEKLVERAREKLRALGKSLNQEIRDHLQHVAGDDDVEQDIEFLRKTAGPAIGNGTGMNSMRNG